MRATPKHFRSRSFLCCLLFALAGLQSCTRNSTEQIIKEAEDKYMAGDCKGSLELLKEVEKTNSRNVDMLILRSKNLTELKDYASAIDDLKLVPDSLGLPIVNYLIGRNYELMGDPEWAMIYYNRSLELMGYFGKRDPALNIKIYKGDAKYKVDTAIVSRDVQRAISKYAFK